MIGQQSLLVTLLELVDCLPVPPPPPYKKRGPGRPRVYTDRLFLKALVVMIAYDTYVPSRSCLAC